MKVLQGLSEHVIISCVRVLQSLFTFCAEPQPSLRDIMW